MAEGTLEQLIPRLDDAWDALERGDLEFFMEVVRERIVSFTPHDEGRAAAEARVA